jgi:hypothetical protein
MASLKLVLPRRCNEFRVTFRGQYRPQRPVLEITNSRHGWEMFATYDPYMNGAYDPQRWFIQMPYGIKMNEIRSVMKYIASDVIAMIDAQISGTTSDMIAASERLTDTVNLAIRDCVRDYDNV